MGMGIIPTLILASLFFIFLEEQGPPQCISEQCPCFYFERLVTINQLNLSPSCLRFQCVIFYYIYTSTRQAAGAAVWSFSHMNSEHTVEPGRDFSPVELHHTKHSRKVKCCFENTTFARVNPAGGKTGDRVDFV